MKVRLMHGKILSGENETEIVTLMRDLENDQKELSLEKYMQTLVERAKLLARVVEENKVVLGFSYENFNPQLAGSTEEQCRNLITAMVSANLITIIQD